MNIKLTVKQFDCIKNILAEDIGSFGIKLNFKKKDKYIFLEIENDKVDQIRDLAMEKQVEIGFDMNYELTSDGKILDEIIDLFQLK